MTQMRDGTYAPNVPIEPNLRFRRFGPQRAAYYQRYGIQGVPMLRLAATREVLRPHHSVEPGRLWRQIRSPIGSSTTGKTT